MADRIPMFSVYDAQGNRIEIPAIAGRSAYKEAVAQGYQGTQEEFGLEQANFASNAAQVAADREACEAAVRDINNILVTKADPSIKVELILPASGWTGSSAPYTQTILIDGLTPEQNGVASSSLSTTAEQRSAMRDAIISVLTQENGSITFVADGILPTIDLPITVILYG